MTPITPVTYASFWNTFKKSDAYKKLIQSCHSDQKIQLFYFNLLELIIGAKTGFPETDEIQKFLNAIYLILSLSEEEKLQLNDLLDRCNLSSFYSIPDDSYISSHAFDLDTQEIVEI